jgi:EmrB/QacA subfamily drug resistance transporter
MGDSKSDKQLKQSVLIIATVGSFIMPFLISAINLALPAIGKDLQIDAVRLSWVATSFLLSAGVFLVPLGRFADIFGRKKIILIGFCLVALGSLGCGFAPSFVVLIIFRVVQGLGSAMISGTGLAIITSVFPPQERGKVLGITVSAVYIGLSSGPFLGGMFTQYLTWRSLFFFSFILCLVVIYLIMRRLKGEWAEARGESFDIAGSLIYGFSLICLIYGLSRLPETLSIVLLALGCVGIFGFIQLERRRNYPVFPISLFTVNKAFAFSSVAALINYSATFAVTFLLSLYLQYIKGFAPQIAGIILLAQPIIMASFSPLAGKLSDRIEPRIIASIGMILTCLGLIGFIFLTSDTSILYVIALLIIMGFGFALFSSPNMNAIMSAVERRHLGIAAGAAGTMRLLGQMFSMGIATLIFTLCIGRVQITPQTYDALLTSLHIAFIIFAVMCFCGIFVSLNRGDIRN